MATTGFGAGFVAAVLVAAVVVAAGLVAAAILVAAVGMAGLAGALAVCTDLGIGGGGVDNQSSPIMTLLTDTTSTTTYKMNDIPLPGILYTSGW